MKKYISILLSILCILLSVGCGEGKETVDIQGILVDGVFYEKSYQPMPAEVDESAIIGYVESYTDTIPKKDGESNISKDIIGAPYAKVEGGIAILYENEWYLCKAETSEEEPAKKSVQKVETPDFGITLTVKNVTSKGLTLVCEQSGGESIGELFSGNSYSLSRYVEGNWETIEYLPKDTEVAWTDEAWIIPLEDTVEWEVNWEWLYGELVPGKYRMSKPVMNLAGPGDFNTAMHFVEFDVAE